MRITTISLLFAALLCMAEVSADPFSYEALNYAAFEAHNKARTNPGHYAQAAQNELENKFVYDRNGNPTNTICLADDFVPRSHKCYFTMATTEGPRAWREATQVMSKQKALPALQWSAGLAQACYDHIRDSGPKGLSGHTGSDGSSPHDRIAKYVDTMASGENLAYSDTKTGEDMILQLIVDDGVPSRGHRDNILSADFTHVGISCGCHSYYTEMCCYAYGRDVKEKNPSRKADVAPQLKSCAPYSPTTKGTTSGNFEVGSQSKPAANKAGPSRPSQPNPEADPHYTNPASGNDWVSDLFPGLFGNVQWSEPNQNNPQQYGNWFDAQHYQNDWSFGGWVDDIFNGW